MTSHKMSYFAPIGNRICSLMAGLALMGFSGSLLANDNVSIEPVVEIEFAGFEAFQNSSEGAPLVVALESDNAAQLLNYTTSRLAENWRSLLTGQSSEAKERENGIGNGSDWSEWVQAWALRPWTAHVAEDADDSGTLWAVYLGGSESEAATWSHELRLALDLQGIPQPFDRKYGEHDGWRIDFGSQDRSLHCVVTGAGLGIAWEGRGGSMIEAILKEDPASQALEEESLIQVKLNSFEWSWFDRWAKQWSRTPYSVTFNVRAETNFFRVLGDLEWAEPVELSSEPWAFPVDLIRDPLIQLSAMRLGPESTLSENLLQPLGFGSEVPTQAYFWAMPGNPIQTFFAFPSTRSMDELKKWIPDLTQRMDKMVKSINMGEVVPDTDGTKAVWSGFPFNIPFAGVVESLLMGDVVVDDVEGDVEESDDEPKPSQSFVMMGLFPPKMSPNPVPEALVRQFSENPATVYYSWEFTSLELKKWGQFLQLVDLISRPRLTSELVKEMQSEGKEVQVNPKNAADELILEMGKMFSNTISVWEAESSTHWTFNRKAPAILNGFEMAYLLRTLGGSNFPEQAKVIPRREPAIEREGPSKPMFFYTQPQKRPAAKPKANPGLTEPK
jgi:hypothetical protein